jgi:hypothetical protein
MDGTEHPPHLAALFRQRWQTENGHFYPELRPPAYRPSGVEHPLKDLVSPSSVGFREASVSSEAIFLTRKQNSCWVEGLKDGNASGNVSAMLFASRPSTEMR